MGKLVKLLVLVAIIVVVAYVVMTFSGDSESGPRADTDQRDERPRLEEKYGFTSETVGD
ncbi:MAG: hypothetical protein KKI02_02350 [Planctomycetes bacterium]|nr:hypothetical protein [Planctomycetota bacterium]